MTTHKWNLKIDADLPGVVTTVTQEIDFSKLTPTQLRRCVNAVRRGHTARGGYVAGLVRAAARHLGVAPPVTISTTSHSASVWPLPRHKYEPLFADLVKMSDVRWQLWLAQHPRFQSSPYYMSRKSGWDRYREKQLILLGWDQHGKELRERVNKVLKKAGYSKGLQQLADFIESAPRFEVSNVQG